MAGRDVSPVGGRPVVGGARGCGVEYIDVRRYALIDDRHAHNDQHPMVVHADVTLSVPAHSSSRHQCANEDVDEKEDVDGICARPFDQTEHAGDDDHDGS